MMPVPAQMSRFQRMGIAGTLLYQFKREIAWVLLFSLFVNMLAFTPTLYMMQIYTRIMLNQSLTSLLIISLAVTGFLLVMTYADMLRSKVLITMGNKVEVFLSDKLFTASLQRFLQDKRTEPSESLRAAVEFKQFVAGMALVYFFDVLWTPVYILVAFLLHPLLGWVSIGVILIQCVLLFMNHWLSANLTAQQHSLVSQQQHFVHANLRSLLPVFAMGYGASFKQRWYQTQQRMAALDQYVRGRTQPLQSLIRFYRYAVQTLSLGVGAYLAIQGLISVGSMIAANLIIGRSLSPFDHITQVWPQWMGFLKANRQLTALIGAGNEALAEDTPPSEPLLQIALRGFQAGYQAGQPVLRDIHLQFQAGQVLAVMGASGSGKTTLIKSLLGLVPHTGGEIVCNEQAFQHPQQARLSMLTGYLPQDFQLFEGTVAENIARFGALDSAAVTQAAIQAGIHEWVLRMPRGYDTMIGPYGQVLSGGQKQQLGLARAIYGHAQLIILDEPNSNLDDHGERCLHQLLDQLKQEKKIVIIVSHREQVLSVVDQIVWLEAGTVKAFGARESVYPALKAQGIS